MTVWVSFAPHGSIYSEMYGYVWLQYSPPLIPPRGEVNAADAFDIGSFDEEDTKGIKVQHQNVNQAQHLSVLFLIMLLGLSLPGVF